MGRLQEIEDRVSKMEGKSDKRTEKSYLKFLKRLKRLGKKADKSIENVLVQYLTQKNEVRWMVCKIVSGNIVVINNKVHKLNPKKIWRYKKHLWYIIREIDRRPVSNQDYEEVQEAGQGTDEDVPLIKAFLGATSKKPIIEGQGKIIAFIIIGLIVAGILFFLFKG